LRLLANKLDEGQVILEIKAEEEPNKKGLKHSPDVEVEWNDSD